MARPRKTLEQLKASGSYRPSRHDVREAEAVTPPSTASNTVCRPSDLTPSAAIVWDRLVTALEGRVTAGDMPLLTEATKWLDEAARCRDGLAGLSPTSLEYGRLLKAAAVAASAADKILSRFALTPKDRARIPYAPGFTRRAAVEVRPKTTLDRAGAAPEGADPDDDTSDLSRLFDGPGIASRPKTAFDLAGPHSYEEEDDDATK